jgi:hypothetical protein
LAGSAVDGFGRPIFGWIRMGDTLGQGLMRCQGKNQNEHQPERFHLHFPLSLLTN